MENVVEKEKIDSASVEIFKSLLKEKTGLEGLKSSFFCDSVEFKNLVLLVKGVLEVKKNVRNVKNVVEFCFEGDDKDVLIRTFDNKKKISFKISNSFVLKKGSFAISFEDLLSFVKMSYFKKSKEVIFIESKVSKCVSLVAYNSYSDDKKFLTFNTCKEEFDFDKPYRFVESDKEEDFIFLNSDDLIEAAGKTKNFCTKSPTRYRVDSVCLLFDRNFMSVLSTNTYELSFSKVRSVVSKIPFLDEDNKLLIDSSVLLNIKNIIIYENKKHKKNKNYSVKTKVLVKEKYVLFVVGDSKVYSGGIFGEYPVGLTKKLCRDVSFSDDKVDSDMFHSLIDSNDFKDKIKNSINYGGDVLSLFFKDDVLEFQTKSKERGDLLERIKISTKVGDSMDYSEGFSCYFNPKRLLDGVVKSIKSDEVVISIFKEGSSGAPIVLFTEVRGISLYLSTQVRKD